MESDFSLSAENHSRATTASHHDHSLVDDRSMVPHASVTQPSSSFTARSDGYRQSVPDQHLANDKQQLEARRMEVIRAKYDHLSLNGPAQQLLIQHRLKDSATNRSYKHGQLLFIRWTMARSISPTNFTPTDLINFLSDIFTQRSYSVTTLQLFRSAVTHLHPNPSILRHNDDINSFFTVLLHQAPPIRIHRPTIDLRPTFHYLRQLDNMQLTLSTLQSKLAFLLGVTCFFRPSDLQRILFSSAKMSDDQSSLSLEVHCPKEKRGRRFIIKSFSIKAHCSELNLCPVATFAAFIQKRPTCSASSLFVNSLQPDKPISPRTIQRWIQRLLQMSTTEPRVSLRSVASSLALQSGIPKEDIITMGNWSNSSTFENHYRREHLSLFDFTNTLITLDDSEQVSDDDVFYDAPASFDTT